MQTIAVASDHAGFELKTVVIQYLKDKGFTIKDFGCYSSESCDYADFAHPLANAVEKGEAVKGIVFCASGNGINMTVNKHNGIRSAICWDREIALLARHHNDANICSLPSRFVTKEESLAIVDIFLNEAFDGGRHFTRISKVPIIPRD